MFCFLFLGLAYYVNSFIIKIIFEMAPKWCVEFVACCLQKQKIIFQEIENEYY